MTAHAAIAASPKAGTPNRTLMQALLVSRVAYILASGEDPQAFDPRGEDGSPVTQVIGYNGLWFWLDEADTTTGHDGTTCIVTTATGGRYKVANIDLLITSVLSKTVAVAPDPDDEDEEARPSNGDAYIVPTAASGAEWASHENDIAIWVEARREWFYIAPKPGWFVSIPGETRDIVYRYDSVQQDWITGGGDTPTAATIPLNALIGFGLGPVRVQNQTTYAPPGSRKTGATPAMPLGGTASNINDNSDSTTATTSAIGDKSGASVADRIFAKLTLAAATDLIAIEVRGLLGSAASSSAAVGIYYSTDGGTNWTQAGSGITLSTSAQDVMRTGTFSGVTDVAVVTEAKNWSSNTHTLKGLNAFDATVDASVGDAVIIGSPAIGIFAGREGQVAICEVADSFAFYAPQAGNKVYDIALGVEISWTGSVWRSPTAIVDAWTTGLTTGTINTVTGSGIYVYSSTTAPTRSQLCTLDPVTLTVQAKKVGARLRFRVRARVENASVDSGSFSDRSAVLALFRGVAPSTWETNAVEWIAITEPGKPPQGYVDVTFEITATDTDEHIYQFGVMSYTTTSTFYQVRSDRRLLTCEEFG